ncbi:hypothetical protein DN752_17950 [Echinicola strongylocentroti]|uniref:Uncharacterized protein n=1 Tax=Echinicola strongylocentroti TaxID=1795355 RepID=A0A2Z4ILU8_9BACT|nr:hypothetical protein [Echinicola strongylocentroti]AWW31864.1 hypothetical protein DN752_17950 [Echinicola strongylocentroti]
MEIENIIYETTRGIHSVDDKLRIATIFIFCWKLNNKKFAELLYTANHTKFINNLNNEYSNYQVDFTIKLTDKNIKDCFYKTLEKIKHKYDKDGFYKALFEGDEFAVVIDQIVNYNIQTTGNL